MEQIFRLYGIIHLIIKKILGRPTLQSCRPQILIKKQLGCIPTDAPKLWNNFIETAKITSPNEFAGFYYAGYILEKKTFCLESWIWTNATIVRLYSNNGNINQAKVLCENLIARQQECGGWIVRCDYDGKGEIPMLAPNDSAYIANNAFLSMYGATSETRYLEVAERCANWIIDTSREDGMVYTGYNMRDSKWDKKNIIVDVGFTAGLFANLYELTGKDKYLDYLNLFVYRYIKLFFNSGSKGFITSVDYNDRQQGGMFARGQAWALEGLIPAYKVINSHEIRTAIESTIQNLLEKQNNDGSWPYNLTRKLMGNDCKGVPVIAKSLMEWYSITQDSSVRNAANKALEWCIKHTSLCGMGKGGIFSYCVEGSIVKDLYSSCAFVYASVYAQELNKILSDE